MRIIHILNSNMKSTPYRTKDISPRRIFISSVNKTEQSRDRQPLHLRQRYGRPMLATTTASIPQLSSIADLPLTYKAVLLDQFGVVHDGTKPYPGSIEAVKHLADRGLKILVLSNSSRRSSGALNNLERMGFPTDSFFGIITSGEVTHQALSTRPSQFWQHRSKCIHITWGDRGAISLEGLGLKITQDPLEADCIIAHGTEALGTEESGEHSKPVSLENIKECILKPCAARGLPMIVANPDIVTVHGSELRTMPGTLAQWYNTYLLSEQASKPTGKLEELQQTTLCDLIHLMGKPAPIIYAQALQMLGLDKSEVVAIGDSLEHDIRGAMLVGVDSVFVGGGIHKQEVADHSRLQHVCQQYDCTPTFYIEYLQL